MGKQPKPEPTHYMANSWNKKTRDPKWSMWPMHLREGDNHEEQWATYSKREKRNSEEVPAQGQTQPRPLLTTLVNQHT